MSMLPITGDSVVNDTVRHHPETITVFNDFGIDTCCGGGVCITDAARRDGVNGDDLLAALRAVIDPAGVPR